MELNRPTTGTKKTGCPLLSSWVLPGTILKPVVLRKTVCFCYEMQQFAKVTDLL